MLRKRHGAGVKPAVDHLGHTLHSPAALGAGTGNLVNIRSVQLHGLRRRVAAHLLQFLAGTDRLHVTASLALPHVQGRAPITVTGNAPVLNVFQPVAETPLADGLRDPVYGLVVAHQIVAHRRHLDKPWLPRIVDQRRVASPAERIVMLELGRVEKFSFFI